MTRDLYALHAVFEILKKSVAGDRGVAIASEKKMDRGKRKILGQLNRALEGLDYLQRHEVVCVSRFY